MQPWQIRQSKRNWAAANPDKVRRANKLWRKLHRTRTNAQAAARMRRYRKRLRAAPVTQS